MIVTVTARDCCR